MTAPTAQVLVNLAQLSSDSGLRLVSRFLPELAAARPDDAFVVLGPDEYSAAVTAWGANVQMAPVSRHRRPRSPWGVAPRVDGRRPDVILGPLSHVPLLSRVPQIVWAGKLPMARRTDDRPDALRATMTRVFTARTGLVIYPTAAARRAAETLGLRGAGLILRPPLRDQAPSTDHAAERSPSGPLRIAVPVDDEPGQNLELLKRVSTVLTRRDVDHQILVTEHPRSGSTSTWAARGPALERDDVRALREQADVVLLPGVGEPSCSRLVELEQAGLPVAASNIGSHVELRSSACLFDPSSPHGAADALLAAVGASRFEDSTHDSHDWRFSTPREYAAVVSAEIDRLIAGEEISWAV